MQMFISLMPEAPKRETRPDHDTEELRRCLFAIKVWVNFPFEPFNTEETGSVVYSLYLKRIERQIICRCQYKGSIFSSVILRPRAVGPMSVELKTSSSHTQSDALPTELTRRRIPRSIR